MRKKERIGRALGAMLAAASPVQASAPIDLPPAKPMAAPQVISPEKKEADPLIKEFESAFTTWSNTVAHAKKRAEIWKRETARRNPHLDAKKDRAEILSLARKDFLATFPKSEEGGKERTKIIVELKMLSDALRALIEEAGGLEARKRLQPTDSALREEIGEMTEHLQELFGAKHGAKAKYPLEEISNAFVLWLLEDRAPSENGEERRSGSLDFG